jgi:hypothetical protein
VGGGVRLPVGRLRAFGYESTLGAPATFPRHLVLNCVITYLY